MMDEHGKIQTSRMSIANIFASFYEELDSKKEPGVTNGSTENVNGDEVHFFNNRSFEERVADKQLGLIKHLMVSSGKFPPGEVKIIWPQRTVALGTKRVAWFEGNKFVTSKSAKLFEKEMETRLKSWIEKRTPDLEIESE
jgi:hypothetical protein